MKKRANLKARYAARKDAWFRAPNRPAQVLDLVRLFNKSTARPFVERFGIANPALLYDACELDAIDFDSLPARVVIKPFDGWDSDSVFLMDGDVDLMTGKHIPRASLKDACRLAMATGKHKTHGRVIVEELLQDFDPRFAIPRDFKIFTAGGSAWVIQVIDRNAHTVAFYTRDWRRLADPFNTHYMAGPDVERPAHLRELIEAAERLSRELRIFMRLDFYLTPRGVVFGEFTPTPADGYGFTTSADRFLCKLMNRFPDDIVTRASGPAWLNRAIDAFRAYRYRVQRPAIYEARPQQ